MFLQILHIGSFLAVLAATIALTVLVDVSEYNEFLADVWPVRVVLFVLQLPFLPVLLVGLAGVLLLPAYPGEPTLSEAAAAAAVTAGAGRPFLCIRVVTRGDYPELVRSTVDHNVRVCRSVGLDNFMVEVVTQEALDLSKLLGADGDAHSASRTGTREFYHQGVMVREIVVPTAYKTAKGSLYKGRNLQFCLEPEQNILSDGDWILHFDEETALTQGAMIDMLNFMVEDRGDLGQGLITYTRYPCSPVPVVNWVTTLFDMSRIIDDFGLFKFSNQVLKGSYFGVKGACILCKYSAERQITWDFGPDSSVCEDTCFGLVAIGLGYKFAWINGEVQEQSPYTVMDYIHQRKRWVEGIWLIIMDNSCGISKKLKIIYLLSHIYYLMPILQVACIIFNVNFLMVLLWPHAVFTAVFSVIKSVEVTSSECGIVKFLLIVIGTLCIGIPQTIFDLTAFIWGVSDALRYSQHGFHVVQKGFKLE